MLKKYLKAGFGGAGSQAINLIALPIIARLYGPEAFAAWAIVMAGAGIAGGISCFRYELAIVIPKDDQRAAALFWLCILSSATMAVVSATLLFCCWQLGMLRSGGVIGLSCYTIFTPLMVFAMGCTLALRYWHVRLGHFTLNSFSMLALSLSAFLVQSLWAVVFNGDYKGLLMGSLAGQLATVLVLAFGWKRGGLPGLDQAMPGLMFDTARNYKRFFQYSTPYALFGVIRNRAPVLVLEAFLSLRDVGLYSLAYRVMYFPLSLVSGALRPVIFQAAATEGVKAVEGQINKILAVLAVMVTPVIVVYFFYADELFIKIFGAEWAGAGHIGQFIIVPVFAFLFCGWMDRILDVLGHQRLMMVMELFFAGLSIAGLWMGMALGYGLYGALFLQCIILTSYAMVYLFLSYDRAAYNKHYLFKVAGLIFFTYLTSWLFIKFIRFLFSYQYATIR